ncbi:hypothetical protein ACA910_009499 [Epithemia clementina (nom. ined.)]
MRKDQYHQRYSNKSNKKTPEIIQLLQSSKGDAPSVWYSSDPARDGKKPKASYTANNNNNNKSIKRDPLRIVDPNDRDVQATLDTFLAPPSIIMVSSSFAKRIRSDPSISHAGVTTDFHALFYSRTDEDEDSMTYSVQESDQQWGDSHFQQDPTLFRSSGAATRAKLSESSMVCISTVAVDPSNQRESADETVVDDAEEMHMYTGVPRTTSICDVIQDTTKGDEATATESERETTAKATGSQKDAMMPAGSEKKLPSPLSQDNSEPSTLSSSQNRPKDLPSTSCSQHSHALLAAPKPKATAASTPVHSVASPAPDAPSDTSSPPFSPPTRTPSSNNLLRPTGLLQKLRSLSSRDKSKFTISTTTDTSPTNDEDKFTPLVLSSSNLKAPVIPAPASPIVLPFRLEQQADEQSEAVEVVYQGKPDHLSHEETIIVLGSSSVVLWCA